MNNFRIIGILIGIIALSTSTSGCNDVTPDRQMSKVASYEATDITFLKVDNGVNAPMSVVKPPITLINENTKITTMFTFAKVNGITLYEDQDTVVSKLGEPDSIILDPDIRSMKIYNYLHMNISFYDGILNYVEVLPDAGVILIDETSIQTTLDDLMGALGKPDYIADDGIVFQHNTALIKIFIDENTGELVSIDYYHISST